MIIFNLPAILVAVICVIVALPIVGIMSLIPGISENETLQGVILYGLVTLVSGICEAVGLKGRLFFIPMWFLGFVLTFATVCNKYGWTGFGVMVLLGIGMMGLIYCLASHLEKKEWAAAPGELAECQRIGDLSRKDFWEHFQKALHIPTMKSYTPEICYHNYYCLELLKNGGVDWPIIDSLMSHYSAKTHDDTDADIQEEMTTEIAKLISEKLEEFGG